MPPPASSAVPLLFTDDADGIMAWLDTASRLLNPSSVLHHRVSAARLHALFRAIPPPPPSLQERWAVTVWAMPNEPFPIYLVRCLAHHFALTRLSPHITPDPSVVAVASTAAPSAPTGFSSCAPDQAVAAVSEEVGRVVALRTRPCHADLAQTGCDPQPCPQCRNDPGTDAADAAGACARRFRRRLTWQQKLLPLRYGGDTCPCCGQAYPLAPVWTRRRFFVLQRASGTRVAAVAIGDGIGAAVGLGQQLHILFYMSQTESQQPLLVVHSAAPVAGSLLRAPAAAPPHPFAGIPFMDLCRCVCPAITGQETCKGLLLLSAAHTLYKQLRAAGRPAPRWPSLHLLLVGPAKCGKTTLLQGSCRLYGPHAETVAGTVVHRPGSRAGSTFADALPSLMNGLLLSGTITSAAALFVDDAAAGGPPQPILLQLRQLLEDGDVTLDSGANALAPLSSGMSLCGSSAVACGVQLVAGVHEESRLAAPLAQLFPLVACVTPRRSLAHTATIGHAAVAASVARSSRSRSASAASCGQDDAGACATVRVTAETLLVALRLAPEPAVVETRAGQRPLTTYFTAQLTQHAGLLEAGAAPRGQPLPLPASLRGGSSVPSASERLSPFQRVRHLRTLIALTQARFLLAGCPDSLPWETAAAEVWSLYLHHLRSVAQQAGDASGAGRAAVPRPLAASPASFQQLDDLSALLMTLSPSHARDSVLGADGESAAHPTSTTAPGGSRAALEGAGWASIGASRLGSSGKRRRSKKAERLLLIDLMHREQQHRQQQTGGEAVCPFPRAEALFLSLGSAAALGDPFEMVMVQLQHEGLLIRRPAGWHITGR